VLVCASFHDLIENVRGSRSPLTELVPNATCDLEVLMGKGKFDIGKKGMNCYDSNAWDYGNQSRGQGNEWKQNSVSMHASACDYCAYLWRKLSAD
jgi:hypothetical protein